MKYDLVVQNFPKKNSIKKIRTLRLLGKMPFKEAIELFNYCASKKTVTLASGLSKEIVDFYYGQLTNAGFECLRIESKADVPMLINPRLAIGYVWRFGFITNRN